MLPGKNHIGARQLKLNETIPLVPIGNVVLLVPNFRGWNIECLVSSFQHAQRPLNILIEMEVYFFHDTNFADYLSLDQERAAGKKRNFAKFVISAVIEVA